jgi:hypothetical protein
MHVFRSAAQLLLQTKDEGRIHCSFAAKVVAAANKDGCERFPLLPSLMEMGHGKVWNTHTPHSSSHKRKNWWCQVVQILQTNYILATTNVPVAKSLSSNSIESLCSNTKFTSWANSLAQSLNNLPENTEESA